MKKRFHVTSSRGHDWQHHKWVHTSPIRGSISSPMATPKRRCMLTPSSCLSCLPRASMTFSSAIMSTRENNTNSGLWKRKKNLPRILSCLICLCRVYLKTESCRAACFTWNEGIFLSAIMRIYRDHGRAGSPVKTLISTPRVEVKKMFGPQIPKQPASVGS